MTNIISVDTTWEAGSSHMGGVQVANGVTLTIEEGVTVYGGEVIVAGNLIVTGSKFSPVVFDDVSIIADGASLNVDFALFKNASSVFQLDSINQLVVANSTFINNYNVFNDSGGYETYNLSNNIFLMNDTIFNMIRLTGDSVISGNYFYDNNVIFNKGYFFGNTVLENNNFDKFDELITAPVLGYGYGSIVFNDNFFGNLDVSELASYVYDGRDDVRYSIIQFTPSEFEVSTPDLKNIQISAMTSTMLPELSIGLGSGLITRI